MRLELICHGFSRTDAIRHHVENRLTGVGTRHGEHLRNVRVTLGDVNGTRNGKDMYCRIVADLTTQRTLCLEKTSESLYDAITLAASALDRAIRAEAERDREVRSRVAARP